MGTSATSQLTASLSAFWSVSPETVARGLAVERDHVPEPAVGLRMHGQPLRLHVVGGHGLHGQPGELQLARGHELHLRRAQPRDVSPAMLACATTAVFSPATRA